MKEYLFTSESVTEGHPDKVCDKISDKILDEALKVDLDSHMAVEVTIKDNLIFIYGEANTKANLDYEKIADWVLNDIGYHEQYQFLIKISKQSEEINEAVVKEDQRIGAGDQGIMFGYACDETENYMPLPIVLAHKLAYKLTLIRKNDPTTFLLPDGKSQVTVLYQNDKPVKVTTIVLAAQHKKEVSSEELKSFLVKNVIEKVIPKELIDSDTEIIINGAGSFTIGGPYGDSGTTGRKIVVDSYGGMARVGGGCFSSKDPSKVDRTAAYYARYVARNIISHQLAHRVEVGLAYVIGKEKPVSIFIDTFGTEIVSMKEIYDYVYHNFDFSVTNMIEELDLKRPIYYDLAAYGHFGRKGYSFEREKK